MRTFILIIIALFSITINAQDTTWLKASQLGYDRASLHPKLISNRIVSSCNVKNGGGTWHNIFSEYNRNGDLVKSRNLLRQYFEHTVFDWMEFKNKNILVRGDGVTSTSNANVVNISAIYDSNGDRILALEKDSAFTDIIQKNDTSFFAIDKVDSLRLGYYNSDGGIIWKKPVKSIIGLPKIDSINGYRLMSVKSFDEHINILFQLKDKKSYWLIKCNNNGVRIKSDTFKMDGFVNYTESWNGFVMIRKTSINKGEIDYLDSNFTLQWAEHYHAEKNITLHSLFINNKNEIMVSVQYSHYDSTKIFKGITYFTRIYSYAMDGVQKNAYEYKLKNYAIQAGINTQFSDSGYFLFFGFYGHLAQAGEAEMGRTNSSGEIHDSAWIGFPIFPDVSVKDTNLSAQELNSFHNLSIYPNPTSSTLTISTQNTNQLSYTLLDLNGRQVLFGNFSKQTQLDVSALKTGMYFLRVENKESGEIVTQKVIVGR